MTERRLSCWFMFDRHAFAKLDDLTEEQCVSRLLELFEQDRWGGVAGRWKHDEAIPSFSHTGKDGAAEALREYVRQVYAGETITRCGWPP